MKLLWHAQNAYHISESHPHWRLRGIPAASSAFAKKAEHHLIAVRSAYQSFHSKLLDVCLRNSFQKWVNVDDSETAVSLGAVLRTLEKGDGPERISKSSYGFLRTEPHEPEICHAHTEQRPTTDKLDGKKYIRNTIDWLVKVASNCGFPAFYFFMNLRDRANLSKEGDSPSS